MSLLNWSLFFATSSIFTLWVMRWGGAEWMEGWKSFFFIDWFRSSLWSAEQIKLYFLLLWLLHVIWFVVGIFIPMARAFP
ncbi:hypothetical protein [Herminiimonas arsenitoxidans]|uniref:hypothetical protein n=1 Tax=Herminiimonas arsenitoxidans TaxID=1809410 RepID=UPI000970D672|nr:hypothetical protein [Herminiimonas arsenitoxidans]